MSKITLQAIAIQKTLEMSEKEALKVLVFMAGMKAGADLQLDEMRNPQCNPPKQLV